MSDLDPRITIMPDGSYFYSGSLRMAPAMGKHEVPRLSDDWLKGPHDYYEEEQGRPYHFKGSRVFWNAVRERRGSKVRVDSVTDYTHYTCIYPTPPARNLQVHRKTDVTLEEVCSRYLSNPHTVSIFTSRPYRGGYSSSRSRNAHKGYGFIITSYRARRHTIFSSQYHHSNLVIIPVCHGVMNKSEARLLHIYRTFDWDESGYSSGRECAADFWHGYTNFSPIDHVEEWLTPVCQVILGIKPSIEPFLSQEQSDLHGFEVYWNINVNMDSHPQIVRHYNYGKNF